MCGVWQFMHMRNPFAKGARRTSKYAAQPTYVDGVRFASKKEAKRWVDLCRLQSAGVIRSLERQVRFSLKVNGQLVTTYIADFTYEECYGTTWVPYVEDSKGFKTPEFKIKEKLMLAIHGITIRIT